VARTIAAAGLESYYETRSAPGAPPPEVPPAAPEVEPQGHELTLIIDRVRCAACLWLVEQTLRRVPGVEQANVNYATQRAQIAWDPAQTSLARIVAAVRAGGYDAFAYEPRRQEEGEPRARRAALLPLIVGAFGARQVVRGAGPA